MQNYFLGGGSMSAKSTREEDLVASNSGVVSHELNTTIGENISIEGTIQGKEDLVIEGSVKGNIEVEGRHVTVGTKGHVEGEIRASDITVRGRLTGNISAFGKVEITKEGDFNGEIKAKSISVEDGAMLKAVIELEREPQLRPVLKTKSTEQVSSVPQEDPLAAAGKGRRQGEVILD